jgi:predicted dehydrogenase
MSGDKVRFGLIGAGGIAQAYAQAFEDCDVAHIVAVADVRPEAAAALGERLGCPGFASYRQLAETVPTDAVIVCTPPVSHPEVCLHFLERRVHVLCEKPLSISSTLARAMLAAAERAGVLLTMASKFRYVEDVVRAKSLIASGVLGTVVLFENAFTARVDMTTRWNGVPHISGGGVLIDNGTHSVDLTRYFLGPLAEVLVVEGKRVQGLPVEDTARVFVRSVEGVMGNIDLSWSIDKQLDSFINIYGSHGALSVGWKVSRYRQAPGRDWVVFGKGYDKVQAFRSQITNFSRAIRGEEELRITAQDALASVEVIEAGYASLRQNYWTPINVDGRPGPDTLRRERGKAA